MIRLTERRPMTRLATSLHLLVTAAALFSSAGALAQTRAVEATTFNLGVAAREIDTSGSTSIGELGLNLGGTVPLGSLLAASFSAGYANGTVRTREVLVGSNGTLSGVRPSCDIDSTTGAVGLFARRPTLGRIGASYGKGRLSSTCGEAAEFLVTGSDELKTDYYRIDAEAYLGDFTLGASRTTTDPDGGSKLETTAVSASWYPIENLRVSAHGSDLLDQDTYGVLIEHQPDFMGDALGAYVGFQSSDESGRARVISLGFSYHFGARVSLKVRDRQYR